MASINGVSSGNASSIYGSRNVISGLASGMDTETMIENAVSGYQAKITALQQSKTKTEWKMEAYRNLTDQMVQFSRKYTSYTSATNLLSPSFFSKAVLTSAQGANKDYVTASGKSSSDIAINAVKQLATAARYVASGGVLSGDRTKAVVEGTGAVDLAGKTELSNLSGILNLTYGKKTVSISFDETDVYKAKDGKTATEVLKDAIVEKLSEQKVTIGDKTYTADKLFDVKLEGGSISFSNATNSGDNVYISGASSAIMETLGLDDLSEDAKTTSFTVNESSLSRKVQTAEYLNGQSMTVNFNGVNKKIALPKVEKFERDGTSYFKINDGTGEREFALDSDGNVTNKTAFEDAYIGSLNKSLKESFGVNDSGESRVMVGWDRTSPSGSKLMFTAAGEGNTLSITSTAGGVLGLGGTSATSYLNTSKTLGDLMEEGKLSGLTTNADGLYDLTINGTKIGSYAKDTALESILLDINNNADAGINVSYSKLSNQFVFTAKETGSAGRIEYESGGLAAKLFGEINKTVSTWADGQDAIASVTIDGNTMTLTRSNNNFDLDGMSVTLKGTFNADKFNADNKVDPDTINDAVTFKTEADADKIVDAIKGMIEDYNEMATAIKNAYSTMPNYKYKNSGERYEPLTDEQMEGMSETAIKNYEEKAKQGILFGDKDLSSMYSKLRNAFSPAGNDGSYLRSIGITTNYSSGITTVELDENKLRDALTANPEGVKEAFTKTAGTNGSSTDGIMQGLKNTLNTYSSTDGAYKGVLINKAGSKYAALSILDNSLQDSIDNIEDQITKWQGKLSDKVDYYTRKFSALEQLVAQMNSQSSSLMSMMGGGS